MRLKEQEERRMERLRRPEWVEKERVMYLGGDPEKGQICVSCGEGLEGEHVSPYERFWGKHLECMDSFEKADVLHDFLLIQNWINELAPILQELAISYSKEKKELSPRLTNALKDLLVHVYRYEHYLQNYGTWTEEAHLAPTSRYDYLMQDVWDILRAKGVPLQTWQDWMTSRIAVKREEKEKSNA